MRTTSAKYCYLPFRTDTKKKRNVMKEFGKVLIKELVENPDGVQLPNPFGKLIICGHAFRPRAREDISYKYHNSDTGGNIFEVFIQPKVDLFKKLRIKKMKEMGTFKRKVEMYSFARRAIYNMVKEDKWSDHNIYDGLFQLMKNI